MPKTFFAYYVYIYITLNKLASLVSLGESMLAFGFGFAFGHSSISLHE